MRPRRMSFEQLVNQNISELMNDENRLNQLELRIEKRHAERARQKSDHEERELFSSEG